MHKLPISQTQNSQQPNASKTNLHASAAEELEDGRNIRDVDDVSHTEVAKMAEVVHTFVLRNREAIVSEMLGDCLLNNTPTIPPKSKETSSVSCNRLHSL